MRVLLAVLFHMLAVPAWSQTDTLVERTRAATEMYADRSVAIAHGYRRVGRDLPMMGEHWINTRLVIDGRLDVTHPQMLTYLDVGGKPMLTGVVFAIPLAPGESPPDVFGPDAMWHEHNGSVDEEALVPEHHMHASEATGTRVAFLHMWTRVSFSESIYGAENWALPFVRAGVKVPQKFSNAAARCVSVLNGGKAYYLALKKSPNELGECETLAQQLVSRIRNEERSFNDEELQLLDAAWRASSYTTNLK